MLAAQRLDQLNLTLEGLTVSYFLRNSLMYDTLMQMGRWFGYRPGYEDLCRVWMPEDAQGWYEHIAEATEELRSEFKAMEAINATPAQFGLRVRSHPDTLIVTARNKMGTGKNIVVQIGLGVAFIETTVLRADHTSIMANREAARRLAAAMRAKGHDPAGAKKVSGGVLFTNVPVDLITNFVRAFNNCEGAFKTAPEPVINYIEDRQQDELALWDVMFASLKPPVKMTDSDVLGMDIHCQYRTIGDRSNDKVIRVSNKQRVASRGIEKTGLTEDEIERAQSAFMDADPAARKKQEAGEPVNFPDRIYREVRKRPLLIIHLLELRTNNQVPPVPLPAVPVVAWGISFPTTTRPEKKVQYVVGAVWLKENMPDDGDDEDSGGDDD